MSRSSSPTELDRPAPMNVYLSDELGARLVLASHQSCDSLSTCKAACAVLQHLDTSTSRPCIVFGPSHLRTCSGTFAVEIGLASMLGEAEAPDACCLNGRRLLVSTAIKPSIFWLSSSGGFRNRTLPRETARKVCSQYRCQRCSLRLLLAGTAEVNIRCPQPAFAVCKRRCVPRKQQQQQQHAVSCRASLVSTQRSF